MVASISSGDRRFQSAGSSRRLVSRYRAPGRCPSSYSSGTPKLTWSSTILAAVEGLGAPAVEQVAEPVDVDESLVVRQSVQRERLVVGPGGEPRVEDAHVAVAELRSGEPGPWPRRRGHRRRRRSTGRWSRPCRQAADRPRAHPRCEATPPGTTPRPGCGRRGARPAGASRCRPRSIGRRRSSGSGRPAGPRARWA